MPVSFEKIVGESISAKCQSNYINSSLPPSFVRASQHWHTRKPPSGGEKPLLKSLQPSLSSVESIPKERGAAKRTKSDIQENNLPLPITIFLGDKLPNDPVTTAIWKGSFEIVDGFYVGIRAHPPSRVNRNALEAAKQMPEKLQLKLHPRCELWPQAFNKHPPGANDIALYFFPVVVTSCQTKYFYLLDMIEEQDLALRGFVDREELLLFSSKQLPISSHELNCKTYLWGVFRCVNDCKVVCSARRAISYYIPTSDMGNLQKDNLSIPEDSTMGLKIDIIGGIDAEKTDKDMLCTPAPSHKVGSQFHPTEPKLNGVEKDNPITTPEVPPGFEPQTSKSSCRKAFQKLSTNKLSGKRYPDVPAGSFNPLNMKISEIAQKERKSPKIEVQEVSHLKKDVQSPESASADPLTSQPSRKRPCQKMGTRERGGKRNANFPVVFSNPYIVEASELIQKEAKVPKVKTRFLRDLMKDTAESGSTPELCSKSNFHQLFPEVRFEAQKDVKDKGGFIAELDKSRQTLGNSLALSLFREKDTTVANSWVADIYKELLQKNLAEEEVNVKLEPE